MSQPSENKEPGEGASNEPLQLAHGDVKHENDHDKSLDDSYRTTDSDPDIDVSYISDMFVSRGLQQKLLQLKCEYIRHVQHLDENTVNEDVLNSSSIDFQLNSEIEKTVKKTILKPQLADLYLSLLN